MILTQRTVSQNVWLASHDNLADAKQITFGANRYNGLSWTPDGKIVYSSLRNGGSDIWIMEPDGTNQKQLTSSASSFNGSPSVSPDGQYIFFASINTSSRSIWRINIDGSNPKQITDSAFDSLVSSADGRWIVYQFEREIWKVSTDGGTPILVTSKAVTPSFAPAPSPDGRLIACYYRARTDSHDQIALITMEGGQLMRHFDLPGLSDWNGSIQWSPDGSNIEYVLHFGKVSNIWSQPIKGGPPEQLTNFKTDRITRFAWSPDGEQLA